MAQFNKYAGMLAAKRKYPLGDQLLSANKHVATRQVKRRAHRLRVFAAMPRFTGSGKVVTGIISRKIRRSMTRDVLRKKS